MKSFTTLALAAYLGLSSVAAVPHNVHRHLHEKRDGDIVWKTVIDEVVKTVDVTTTIWVTPGGAPPAQSPPPAPVAQSSSSSVAVPAVHPVQSPPPVSSSSVAAPPPPPPSSSAAPAPPPSSSAAAPPPQSSSSSSSAPSSGGSFLATGFGDILPGANESYAACTESTPCGTPNDPGAEASFYSMTGSDGVIGTGACGSALNALTTDFVAINEYVMGYLSSGTPMNPLCGVTVTVKNTATGKTATGVCADKCPGCKTSWGIDLSNHLFDQLASESEGVFPVEWWFNG